MTQPFADALTWMPKSRALGATLTRAHDIARAQGHAAVLLEHLLQALIEDPDASAVLLSCNIDLLNLNAAVTSHLQAHAVSGSSQPAAPPSLLLILEYAAAAARQSKRTEVNGAIVLAAMTGEGKSEAARMLKAAGLKFEHTIQALRKVSAQKPSNPEPAAAQPQPAAAPVRPAPEAVPPPPPISLKLPDRLPEKVPDFVPETVQDRAPSPEPARVAAGMAPSAYPVHDDDPLTTARRRVAASRSGGGGYPALATAAAAQDLPTAQAVHAAAPVGEASAPPLTWAPSPQPAAPASNVRPMRMPPPVPAVTVQPPKSSASHSTGGQNTKPAMQLRAPWTAPGGELAEPVHSGMPQQAVSGEPIDPALLTDGFPRRMQERMPVTVEVFISRSEVIATASAMGAGARDNRDSALTRAVSVRLRAPGGGFFVETAAPETQWFDSRSAQRDDDVVRWRWIVTPQASGSRPLQIAVSMRTVAADGTIMETALPEHQCSIRIGSNYREGLRRLGRAAIAVSAGVAFTLLATGGFASVFGWIAK